MNWPWWAERLLYFNLAWYVALFLAFALAGNPGKSLYFFGAEVLTVGAILM